MQMMDCINQRSRSVMRREAEQRVNGIRIKGRYVALVEIDFDYKPTNDLGAFNEMKKIVTGGHATECIQGAIQEEVVDRFGKVTVTQQYADLYEVKDDGTSGMATD